MSIGRSPDPRPRINIDERGFLYYGRERLPLKLVDGDRLEFAVKHPANRETYGRHITVSLAEVVGLALAELKAEALMVMSTVEGQDV